MSSIQFSSDQFSPALPNVVLSDGGAAGFELALFVAQALAKAGMVVTYPLEEDWCWSVQATTCTRVPLCIYCASAEDDVQPAPGPAKWQMFINAPGSLLQRLRGRPVAPAVEESGQLLREALTKVGAIFE